MKKKLTDRQKEVLRYIRNNQCLVGPTIREIANHFHFWNKAAYDHCKCLEKKGWIRMSGRARGIEIIDD